MKIHEREAIIASLDLNEAVRWLEQGFVAYSQGRVQVPPVQAFAFAQANGDCCVKSAYLEGGDTFTVKVSTGFYDNPAQGLASNDGLMLVFSARTGQPLALLADQGWLTCMRTALAGRIVARLLAPRQVERIGILGTGTQARMQLEQLMPVIPCRELSVWGRSEAGLASYRDFAERLGFTVRLEREPQAVAEAANLIISATPSREALLERDWVRPGTHITAVGADAPGKQELAARLVAKADLVVVDSLSQCSQYGEVSHALQAGLLEHSRLLELGTLLGNPSMGRASDDQLTVADLTGVAVQDAQIACYAYQALRH
ncbi:ornithine cyclodeaminase family protein [Pseudomonas entomophila]|uniref:ornithine cyclodeaminase family protein n=1 Tax=Pseudomonas entomophila TaxID=312306 RepID=UPI002010A1CC|nr:ornithine cyclodeaminase family protein [Pseudomonas entomophila]